MKILCGIITISDRASKGLYADPGGAASKKAAEGHGWKVSNELLVPDEKREVQRAVLEQVGAGCTLITKSRQGQPSGGYTITYSETVATISAAFYRVTSP